MYVYHRAHGEQLWVTGFYDPKGNWHPEHDCESAMEAANRVAWLNGSGKVPEQVTRRRDPALGPALPNGEGIIGTAGLTESEVLQGRESPPGCDPKGGEGLCGERPSAGYHPGSSSDPRD
jgi:hypothetical protein